MFPFLSFLRVRNSGVSLIEAILYVAIFAALFTSTVALVTESIQAFSAFRSKDEVVVNGSSALREVLLIALQARNVYDSTSVFNNAAGQLSVRTAVDAPAGDTVTYVDFYTDNGVLYERKEGQPLRSLINDRVEATSFFVRDVDNSVQIELVLRSKINRPSSGPYSHTFIGSVTPRGY